MFNSSSSLSYKLIHVPWATISSLSFHGPKSPLHLWCPLTRPRHFFVPLFTAFWLLHCHVSNLPELLIVFLCTYGSHFSDGILLDISVSSSTWPHIFPWLALDWLWISWLQGCLPAHLLRALTSIDPHLLSLDTPEISAVISLLSYSSFLKLGSPQKPWFHLPTTCRHTPWSLTP